MEQLRYIFSVNMTYAQCEELYRQEIKHLIVTSIEGKRIQLPKLNMRQFFTPSGLRGVFEMNVDENHKLLSIKRLK